MASAKTTWANHRETLENRIVESTIAVINRQGPAIDVSSQLSGIGDGITNGYEDENGHWQTYWVCGDIAGSAPVKPK